MIDDQRRAARRRMPADIRALVEQLRALARAPGAQTPDGTQWRTISKGTIDLLVEALVRAWRDEAPEPEIE
jgi:hypothetical protein